MYQYPEGNFQFDQTPNEKEDDTFDKKLEEKLEYLAVDEQSLASKLQEQKDPVFIEPPSIKLEKVNTGALSLAELVAEMFQKMIIGPKMLRYFQ